MSNKSIDEIAAELTIAMLDHNSKLVGPNNSSKAELVNVKSVAKSFDYFRDVISGNKDPQN